VYYEPGDHVGIYPENSKELVDGVLAKLVGLDDPDEVCQLQVLKKQQTAKGLF
jgi:nitric-oxide synthase, brain